jgi:hypothetical protein
MKTRRYASRLIFGIVLITGGIGAFNRIIDPFWYYRDIEITSVNKFKGKAVRAYERHVKPQVLLREAPDAVIFGSSYAEIGFPPTNNELTKHGQLKGYNFGIAGAEWERVQCYFNFAVEHLRLKRVVIGIQAQSLPKTDCKDKLPEINSFTESKLLFSRQAVSASLNTVLEQKRIRPDYTKEGLYFYNRDLPGITERFKSLFTNTKCTHRSVSVQNANKQPDDPLGNGLPGATPLLDLDGLKYIIGKAAQQNIELRIVVYPNHALALELDHQCGLDRKHWADLHAIANLTQTEQGDFEIWEFYRYNRYTAESVRTHKSIYWQDPHHFNHEFGDIILNAMFSDSASDIGSKLTSSSVDDAYWAYIISRTAYLSSHPEFLAGFDFFKADSKR